MAKHPGPWLHVVDDKDNAYLINPATSWKVLTEIVDPDSQSVILRLQRGDETTQVVANRREEVEAHDG